MIALDTSAGPLAAEILVVDSDLTLAAVVQQAAPAGTHVTAVTDGYQALHALTERKPEVVVVEPLLPGLSGLDLLRRIHRLAGSTPVILATHSHELMATPEALGFCTVLHKPVTYEELHVAIASALERV